MHCKHCVCLQSVNMCVCVCVCVLLSVRGGTKMEKKIVLLIGFEETYLPFCFI